MVCDSSLRQRKDGRVHSDEVPVRLKRQEVILTPDDFDGKPARFVEGRNSDLQGEPEQKMLRSHVPKGGYSLIQAYHCGFSQGFNVG